jgi:hypothetical protein
MSVPDETPLIEDVANMGALAVADEIADGVLPLDRVAHVIRAAIETYLIFSARQGGASPEGSP